MRATYLKTTALCAMLCPILASAQDKPKAPEVAPTHYKLVYRLLQVGADGKVSNSRSYSTIIVADDPGNSSVVKIRNGDKVPVPTGGPNSPFGQYRYEDIGMSIDTLIPSMHGRQLSLRVAADSTSLVKSLPDGTATPPPPITRHLSWDSNVVVTLDKPTIICTSDNVSDTGKTELELTATQIKEP